MMMITTITIIIFILLLNLFEESYLHFVKFGGSGLKHETRENLKMRSFTICTPCQIYTV